MKLPDFPSAGAVPMADVSELRGSLLHKGEEQYRAGVLAAHAGTQLAQFATEAAVVTSQVQHIDAMNTVADADLKAKQENAHKTLRTTSEVIGAFGGEENVPEEIKNALGGLYTTQADPDGGEYYTKQERNDIPGWMVNPYIYRKKMDAAVEAAGNMITLPGWRNEFLRAARHQVEVETSQHVAQAQKEMYDYLGAKAFITADHLARNGQVDAALQTLSMTQGIPSATVEKEKERILGEAGQRAITAPLGSSDRQYIQSTINGLRGEENEFMVQDQSGMQEKVNVSAVGITQRRRAASLLESHLKQLDHQDDLAAKQAQEKVDKQWRTTFNSALFTDNPAAVRDAYLQVGQHVSELSPGTFDHIYQQNKAYFDGLEKKLKKEPADPNIGALDFIVRRTANQYKNGTGDGTFEWNGNKYNLKDSDFVTNTMLSLGADPKKTVGPLTQLMENTVAGKPVSSSADDAMLLRVLKEAKYDDPKEAGDAMQAAKESADSDDALRQKEGHKPKTQAEREKFYYDWFTHQNQEVTPGRLIKSWTNTETTTIKNIPKDEQLALVRARNVAANLFPPTAEGTIDFYKKGSPLVEELVEQWPSTLKYQSGVVLNKYQKWELAADVLANERELSGWLQMAGKNITPKSLVTQYLLNKRLLGPKNKAYEKLPNMSTLPTVEDTGG